MNTLAKIAYTSIAASVFAVATTASAEMAVNQTDINAPKPYSAYVQDSNGHIVRDAYGLCVHTGYWTPADATVVGCDGVEAKKAAMPTKAKPVPTAEKVTYAADAFFDFDKAVLKPEGKAKLNELIAKLKDINLEAVVSTGHTDSIGTVSYNQKLSVRRAEAVKAYMVHHGVPADRIYVSGKGKSQPIASNKTAEGRAKNRRVEVEVVGTRIGGQPMGQEVEHKPMHHMKEHHKKEHHKPHHKPQHKPAHPAAPAPAPAAAPQ